MQAVVGTISKFIAISLIFITALAHAKTLTGKVVGVMDGDTIEILDATKTTHRIRLEGIDAPQKAQPFGARSKQHLSDQVFGKEVEVQSNKTDKYGRTVGKVMVEGKEQTLNKSAPALHGTTRNTRKSSLLPTA